MRYRNLTDEQREQICNGCGGKGSVFPIPNFMFEASCDHHDFNYWQGCTEADRLKADYEFYLAMKRDVQKLSWWRRPYSYSLSWIYFRAVRRFAGKYFHHAEKKKGWNDLNPSS